MAGKLGRAFGHGHYRRGWHITATVGVFSVAASIGRLMGLNADQMASAFGIAAAQSSGMLRNFGTMTKSFQAGHSARAGYMSAWLAANGMTGCPDIFEGPRGFLAAYGDADTTLDIPDFGAPWKIFEPGIYVKRWPCCYGSHRGMAGVFELLSAHSLRAEEITRIDIGFLPEADKALIHKTASNGLEGKFSIEYCAAAAVIDGEVTLDSFRDEMVRRAPVQDMLK